MNKKVGVFSSIMGLVFIAVIAVVWAMGLMDTAQSYRSPIANATLQPGQPLGPPLAKRVILILVDALRYDTSLNSDVMPVLNSLREIGASATMHSQPPSFSAPGYTTILTGAWPEINDSQLFNPPDDYSTRVFTQDNIFAAAHRAGLKTAVSGYIWFQNMLANSNLSTGFFTPEYDEAADDQVFAAALPWFSQDFQFILIHFDQVDYAGHYQGGPGNPNWDAAAARVDSMIGKIVSRLDLTNDTILVISDHGQITQGGHGGSEKITLLEPFILAGAGVVPGNYGDVNMVDIAPTLSVLLGTNIPASSQGYSLTEMLNITHNQETKINTAINSQQEQLLRAYVTAIGAQYTKNTESFPSIETAMKKVRGSKLMFAYIWRSLAAALIFSIGGVILYRVRSEKTKWIFTGAVLYIILFNFTYVIVSKKTYSLSSFNQGAMYLIVFNVILTTGAILLAWLFTMLGSHALRTGSRKAIETSLLFTWNTIFLLSLPILVSFAINGLFVTWTLPDWHTLFLALLSLIQCLVISTINIVLVCISAILGKIISKSQNLLVNEHIR